MKQRIQRVSQKPAIKEARQLIISQSQELRAVDAEIAKLNRVIVEATEKREQLKVGRMEIMNRLHNTFDVITEETLHMADVWTNENEPSN